MGNLRGEQRLRERNCEVRAELFQLDNLHGHARSGRRSRIHSLTTQPKYLLQTDHFFKNTSAFRQGVLASL